MSYYSDSFSTDVNWLIGYGIDKEEAIEFVRRLLAETPDEPLQYMEE